MIARGGRRSVSHLQAMAFVVVAATVGFYLTAGASPGFSSTQLAEVRAATADYNRVSVAQEDGWELVEGLDHCFDNPGVGAMGYHYINLGLLMDADLDPRAPEALVYAPGPKGQLQLAAVEWIVPYAVSPRDEAAPVVMGHSLHHNDALEVWVLHAWVFKHNPSGMFEDWNPRVTCD